jgi:hypothetical protein
MLRERGSDAKAEQTGVELDLQYDLSSGHWPGNNKSTLGQSSFRVSDDSGIAISGLSEDLHTLMRRFSNRVSDTVT